MRRFTETDLGSPLRACALALAFVLPLASCASLKPVGHDGRSPALTDGSADAAETVAEPVSGWFQTPALVPSIVLPLTEPGLPQNETAGSRASDTGAPRDITVLAPFIPVPGVLPGSMDEPAPPPPKIPVAKTSAAPNPSVATATAPAKPAAQDAAKTEPKPASGAASSAASLSSPAAGQAFSLPSAPASSARSVEAAQAPVAEILVDALRGERFELRFRGSGWTFLGDEDGKEDIRFETRRFEDGEVVFALKPEKADDYLLRFHRQDPVSGERQVSLVRVKARERTASAVPAGNAAGPVTAATPGTAGTSGTAAAGSAAETRDGTLPAARPESQALTPPAAQAASQEQAAGQATANALSALVDPAELLRYASEELGAKRIRQALDALDRYVEFYRSGSDELYYLYGLAYEQDTPYRDIKQSYAYYKRVRDEYPRSLRWKAAAERVAFMERHYYGLR